MAEKNTTQVTESEKVLNESLDDCERSGKRVAYSRAELLAWRFLKIEEQRKKWIEVYCGFGPAVSKEYDGLVRRNNHHDYAPLNFDPRDQFVNGCASTGTSGDEACKTEKISMDSADGYGVTQVDDYAVVDEAYSEEEDGDDYYSSMQRPAFLVTGEPDFDSGPPQDGWEYLRRVRWEAARIPDVKVAKVDKSKLNKEQTAYMPNIPDIEKCSEHLLPSKQWEDAFLEDFSELRMVLSQHEGSSKTTCEQKTTSTDHEALRSGGSVIETLKDATEGVDSFRTPDSSEFEVPISSASSLARVTDGAAESLEHVVPKTSAERNCGGYGPSVSRILAMDSVARVSSLKKRIKTVQEMSNLSRDDCLWLFALCAAVDTPLHADTSAALRCLLRKCASLRAAKTKVDDEVIMINILATIAGRYFGQAEGP